MSWRANGMNEAECRVGPHTTLDNASPCVWANANACRSALSNESGKPIWHNSPSGLVTSRHEEYQRRQDMWQTRKSFVYTWYTRGTYPRPHKLGMLRGVRIRFYPRAALLVHARAHQSRLTGSSTKSSNLLRVAGGLMREGGYSSLIKEEK